MPVGGRRDLGRKNSQAFVSGLSPGRVVLAPRPPVGTNFAGGMVQPVVVLGGRVVTYVASSWPVHTPTPGSRAPRGARREVGDEASHRGARRRATVRRPVEATTSRDCPRKHQPSLAGGVLYRPGGHEGTGLLRDRRGDGRRSPPRSHHRSTRSRRLLRRDRPARSGSPFGNGGNDERDGVSRLSRQSFLAVAGNNPAILLRMLEALARRLRETTEKLGY